MPGCNGAPVRYDIVRGPEGLAEIVRVTHERHDDWWEVAIVIDGILCHIHVTEYRNGMWDGTDVWGAPFPEHPDHRWSMGDIEQADPVTMAMFSDLAELPRATYRQEVRGSFVPEHWRISPSAFAFTVLLALALWILPFLLRWL